MQIEFLCPTCQKRYSVGEQYAGRTVRCASCNNLMQAPTLEEMQAVESPPAVPAPQAPVYRAAVWHGPRRAPTSAPDLLTAGAAGLGAARSGAAGLGAAGPPPIPAAPARGFPLAGWIGIGVAAAAAVAIAVVLLMRGDKSDTQIAAGDDAASPQAKEAAISPRAAERATSKVDESAAPSSQPRAAGSADAATKPAANGDNNKPAESTPKKPLGAPTAKAESTPAAAGNTKKADVPAPKPPPRVEPQEAKGPPLTIWTARPDPRPQEEQASLAPATWADVDVPVLEQQRAIFYSRRQSPYVGVFGGQRGKQYCGSIDLRDGKRKGPFAVEIADRDQLVMSPDGAHFAAKGGTFKDPTVQVFSLEDGELVQTLVPAEPSEILWFDFAAPDQVVISSRGRGIDRRPQLRLWSIGDGKQLRHCEVIEREGSRDLDSLAISPAGRYLAYARDDVLAMVDLENGKCVGEVRLPRVGDFGRVECAGLAFSPRGVELAALATQFNQTYIVVLDLATGKLSGDAVRLQSNLGGVGFRGGPRIDWFADQGLLIDNRGLFHRQLLHAPVYEFAETQERRKLLDWKTAVLVEREDTSRTTMLRTVKLPSEMFAKHIEVLRAGGDLVDANLPKITKPDLSALEDLASTPPAESWQYTPHPVPAGDTRSPVLLSTSAANSHVEQWRVASPRHAMFLRRLLAVQGEPKRFVERYDLETGKLDASHELSPEMSVVDFSADGEFVLFKAGKSRERLDLMSLSGKEHIAGWRPYADFPEAAAGDAEKREAEQGRLPNQQQDDPTRSSQAFVIDHEHVVTMNVAHGIVGWKLPECRAIYRRRAAPKIAVSACRNYLAAPMTGATKGIEVIEARTGRSCGQLSADLGFLDSYNTQMAFRADGKALALVQNRFSHTLVKTFDLTNATSAEAVLPPLRFTSSLSWSGENYLVVDGVLIDVARGAAVWKYEAAQGLQFGPADEAWTIALAEANTAALYRVPIPTQQSRDQLAQVVPLAPLFAPGTKLSVGASVSVPGVNQEALARLIAADLGRRGFTIDESAPVRLTVQASEQSTGRTLEYRRIGRGQEVTITEMAIELQASLRLPSGEERSVHKQRIGMSGGMMEQGENLEARLQDQMRRSFLRHAEHIPMPKYVFNDFAESAVPRSIFNGQQEEIHPPLPTPEDQRKRFEAGAP